MGLLSAPTITACLMCGWIKVFRNAFLNTFASSVLMFLMVLSILEILAFWKKAITWRREHKPKPFWFRVQTLLHLCVLALHITRIVVHGALGPKPLHGYLELSTCFYSIAYIVAMMCLYVERTRTLATRTRKGHGTLLLLFWTIATMTEVLAVVSFQSPLWWFDLEDTVDKVDFGLWISRLFCNLLLFAFGLRAPGLPPRGYALLINDGPSPVDPHQDDDSPENQPSTWASAWKKVKVVWPYIWPQGHYLMQIRVLFCVMLLIAGRVVNVFVPLLNKIIIDALTVTKSHQVEFSMAIHHPECRL